MKTTINELKYVSKSQLNGNWGQGILGAVVPALILAMIMVFVDMIFINQIYTNSIIEMVLTPFSTFMIITMTMRLATGHRVVDFGTSLTPGNNLIKYFSYAIFFSLIELIALAPASYLVFGEFYITETGIENALANVDPSNFSAAMTILYTWLGYMFITIIILAVITIPFFFVPYFIIVDHMGVLEAIKKSFSYTRGNFLRIIGLQLSFFGWTILVGLTFGLLIFYVAPYQQLTYANFFLAVKSEHGEHDVRNPNQRTTLESSFEEEQPEEKDKWDF
jgi:uncharacterized membrane protein